MPNKDGRNNGETATQPLFGEFVPPGLDEWRSEVDRLLKGAPFEKRMLTTTPEGITLQPMYRKEDIQNLPHLHSTPGRQPFVRGSRTVRGTDDAWHIAQELTYPTCEEFNRSLINSLERGLTAVVLPLDLASRSGHDPDQAPPRTVGVDGTSVSSLAGLQVALEGVDLAHTPVFIDAGGSGLPYLGMYIAAARKAGVKSDTLTGAVAADPMGHLLFTGELPLSAAQANNELAAMTLWADSHAPKLGTIWVHGETFADGGAHAAQELGYSLALAVYYFRELESRQVSPEVASRHIRFSFAVGSHFFMEAAKLRAARLLWDRVLESCGIDEHRRSMWMHVRTSRYTKTAFDPYVNMLRTTTEAFSGVVGGADSLQVAPFDQSVRQPDEFSHRIARNTQMILRDEAHLGRILDPAGGSYYVESLTAELASAAWAVLQDIETRGGMENVISDGSLQQEIAVAHASRQAACATRKRRVVGTNLYPNPTETPLAATPLDYDGIQARRARAVSELRTSLSHQEAMTVLARLQDLLNADSATVTDAVIDAAAHGATVGEITRTLRSQDSVALSVIPIPRIREAESFEKLRQAVTSRRIAGDGMTVFLATLGPVGKYMPRLDFASSFFEVGGFDVIRTAGFDSPDTAARAAAESGAGVVVICGLDDTYASQAVVTAKAIRKQCPGAQLVLAGLPTDNTMKTQLAAADITAFIHVKSDVLATLNEIATKLGVQL